MFLWACARPLYNQKGEILGAIESIRDVTDHALSLVDELTGLYNRRGLYALAEHQIKLAHRNDYKLLVVFIDLDGLKMINDTNGHQEGDIALADVGNILKLTFRETDIIARIGGDEFVVFAVESVANQKEILLKRLHENLNHYNQKNCQKINLSISVGITRYDPLHPCSMAELLDQADKRMYEDKRAKRVSESIPSLKDQTGQ